MDPAIALPVHFTVETSLLVAAGLLLAWALLQRERVPAASAAALGVAQVLHAGQFVADDDDLAIVVLRIGALIGLVSVLRVDVRRRLFAGGLAAGGAGAIWAAFAGGGAVQMSVPAHLLLLAGAAALFIWVWLATRPSVRLRVLASFVSVLAVAVVVAGGAVTRVAAIENRSERYTLLGMHTTTLARDIAESRTTMARRAAAISPDVSVALAAGRRPSLGSAQILSSEWVVVLERSGRGAAKRASDEAEIPYTGPQLAELDAVTDALSGDVTTASDVRDGALVLIGAAPVFAPGSEHDPQDVIGVVIAGRNRAPSELRWVVADPDVEVAVVKSGRVASSRPELEVPLSSTEGSFDQIESQDGEQWYASVVDLPDGLRLVVGSRNESVVDATTDLVRAFLIAILAATALAVIAALWLSSRITRPMLDLADEYERVKTDFLASVSHELRTPLTPIRGYTEILRGARIPARDRSEYLDEIGTATQRLERIVALLIDVAAIEAGRFLIDLQEVDPADLLNDAAAHWKDRARRNQIDVRLARSLPSVRADANAIGRVLDELIDNALKFAPGGRVELNAKRTSGGVEISVHDEGPGMDAEKIASATEAFRQVDTGDTRQYGGLGLGLTFANGVLKAHGLRLSIRSEPRLGTTSSFTLPAAGSVTRMPTKAAARKRSR